VFASLLQSEKCWRHAANKVDASLTLENCWRHQRRSITKTLLPRFGRKRSLLVVLHGREQRSRIAVTEPHGMHALSLFLAWR
jgi:hypothetical protein